VITNYITTIKEAFIVFPFISLLFTIPFILHSYHKYGAIHPFRALIIYSFVLYIITIYFLVIFPLPNKSEVIENTNVVKLIPLSFIADFIKETSFIITKPSTYLKALTEPCFYTVAFNLIMTVPFGMYMRYYFKCNIKRTIILSFLLSLFFEITQLTGLYHIYPYAYRVFDVDDLIINTLGGLLGYLIMGLFNKLLPTREEIDDETIKISTSVSGLRRIVLFILDSGVHIILYLIIGIFIKTKYLIYITFIIYYIIIPYINEQYTLGSKFLNVKLEYTNNTLLNMTFRIIFLYFYYYGIIFISIYLMSLNRELNVYILIILFLLLFYIINILKLLKNKSSFYDKLFKVKYISTIKK